MKISSVVRRLVFVAGCSLAGAAEPGSQKDPGTVLLPPFEVRAQGATDFGMSIVTNREVAADGKIAWMLVRTVVPRSAAAQANLRPGDKILRVDRVPILKLSRAAMLSTFFGRKVGEKVQLEIIAFRTQTRHLVELECNEVRIEKRK